MQRDKGTIYIAGPMTGLPEYNYPAFYAAEEKLIKDGWFVYNPIYDEDGASWEECMRHAIGLLIRADAIYMLNGWKESRGATLEHLIAETLHMKVLYHEEEYEER